MQSRKSRDNRKSSNARLGGTTDIEHSHIVKFKSHENVAGTMATPAATENNEMLVETLKNIGRRLDTAPVRITTRRGVSHEQLPNVVPTSIGVRVIRTLSWRARQDIKAKARTRINFVRGNVVRTLCPEGTGIYDQFTICDESIKIDASTVEVLSIFYKHINAHVNAAEIAYIIDQYDITSPESPNTIPYYDLLAALSISNYANAANYLHQTYPELYSTFVITGVNTCRYKISVNYFDYKCKQYKRFRIENQSGVTIGTMQTKITFLFWRPTTQIVNKNIDERPLFARMVRDPFCKISFSISFLFGEESSHIAAHKIVSSPLLSPE